MAWNQGPIQRRILGQADIWDRGQAPDRAATRNPVGAPVRVGAAGAGEDKKVAQARQEDGGRDDSLHSSLQGS